MYTRAHTQYYICVRTSIHVYVANMNRAHQRNDGSATHILIVDRHHEASQFAIHQTNSNRIHNNARHSIAWRTI